MMRSMVGTSTQLSLMYYLKDAAHSYQASRRSHTGGGKGRIGSGGEVGRRRRTMVVVCRWHVTVWARDLQAELRAEGSLDRAEKRPPSPRFGVKPLLALLCAYDANVDLVCSTAASLVTVPHPFGVIHSQTEPYMKCGAANPASTAQGHWQIKLPPPSASCDVIKSLIMPFHPCRCHANTTSTG